MYACAAQGDELRKSSALRGAGVCVRAEARRGPKVRAAARGARHRSAGSSLERASACYTLQLLHRDVSRGCSISVWWFSRADSFVNAFEGGRDEWLDSPRALNFGVINSLWILGVRV